MFEIGFILVHKHKDFLNHLTSSGMIPRRFSCTFGTGFVKFSPLFFPLDTPQAAPSGVQVINVFGACSPIRDPAAWSVCLPLHAPPPRAFRQGCTV